MKKYIAVFVMTLGVVLVSAPTALAGEDYNYEEVTSEKTTAHPHEEPEEPAQFQSVETTHAEEEYEDQHDASADEASETTHENHEPEESANREHHVAGTTTDTNVQEEELPQTGTNIAGAAFGIGTASSLLAFVYYRLKESFWWELGIQIRKNFF